MESCEMLMPLTPRAQHLYGRLYVDEKSEWEKRAIDGQLTLSSEFSLQPSE